MCYILGLRIPFEVCPDQDAVFLIREKLQPASSDVKSRRLNLFVLTRE